MRSHRHNESMRIPGFEKRAAGRRLLVVEDDTDIREALDGLLSTEGFRVTGCCNGREALDWLHSSSKPDLILLDLMMPVMDGWQFRVAQKHDPALATIPVVALSADVTAKAAAIDADAYLKKPVDYETLIDTIDRLLVASEHRELQARLAQADRLTSLGTLAAGVAHEINNPLAYVLLNIGYVSEELSKILVDEADATGKRPRKRIDEVLLALEHARNGAERIRDIVRNLKTFSRPEDDACAPLNVIQVLDSTIAMIKNEIRHRTRLVREFEPAPDVIANEARLGQVFLNVLLNAVQALPEGRCEANEIRVVVKPGEQDRVLIEVHDNGVGIEPQVRGRIFEPFFTTKPVGIGTGLGLAICHGIVTSLGGSLTVQSEVGKGSVFRIELPAAATGQATAALTRSVNPPAVRTTSKSGGRVLVVDDEPVVCGALERLLSNEGEVVAVTSGREALARIQSGENFDVILCDLMMPDMDGQSVYEAFLRTAPKQAERIIFVTGGAFTMRAHDFLARVQNTRLSKPFNVDFLLEIVRARMAEST
jgi:two-component system, cell cycle sensor histidine kinase and response regulator CckA